MHASGVVWRIFMPIATKRYKNNVVFLVYNNRICGKDIFEAPIIIAAAQKQQKKPQFLRFLSFFNVHIIVFYIINILFSL